MDANTIALLSFVVGASGLGGFALSIYNAVIASRKGTIEEWRGLMQEQREVIDGQREVIEEQKKKIDEYRAEIAMLKVDIASRDAKIVERDRMINDLKDWAERLVRQVSGVMPPVEAEKFIRR